MSYSWCVGLPSITNAAIHVGLTDKIIAAYCQEVYNDNTKRIELYNYLISIEDNAKWIVIGKLKPMPTPYNSIDIFNICINAYKYSNIIPHHTTDHNRISLYYSIYTLRLSEQSKWVLDGKVMRKEKVASIS